MAAFFPETAVRPLRSKSGGEREGNFSGHLAADVFCLFSPFLRSRKEAKQSAVYGSSPASSLLFLPPAAAAAAAAA